MQKEHDLQAKIYKKVVNDFNAFSDLFFSIPNGGKRNLIEASRLKQTGVKKGVPDMEFLLNEKTFFFEMKTEKGKTSIEQKKFISRLKKNGFPVYIIRSEEHFFNIFLFIIFEQMKPTFTEEHIRQSYTDLMKIYDVELMGLKFEEWEYQNKIWKFIFDMKIDSRIIISEICEKSNIEKFTNFVRKFIILEMDNANGFTIQFSADYSAFQKLKKFNFNV